MSSALPLRTEATRMSLNFSEGLEEKNSTSLNPFRCTLLTGSRRRSQHFREAQINRLAAMTLIATAGSIVSLEGVADGQRRRGFQEPAVVLPVGVGGVATPQFISALTSTMAVPALLPSVQISEPRITTSATTTKLA